MSLALAEIQRKRKFAAVCHQDEAGQSSRLRL
jgi:hypothetical protein